MFSKRGWIFKRIALSGDKTALVDIDTGASWTYDMLNDRISHWLSFFTHQNVQKGERIALLAPNCSELFAILFACEVKGLIYVPLNWRLSNHELEKLLQDCTPSILLYDDQFTRTVKQFSSIHAYSLEAVKSMGFDDLQIDEVSVEETDPWLMIYTGGTTGLPKGVVLSANAVNWNALNTICSWGLSDADITVNYMPLFHTGGINALSIPILMAGGQVILGNKFDANEALTASNTYEATISLFVPTMYQLMINTPYFHANPFLTMKVFLSGGAPCPTTVYQAFSDKGLHFKEGYGLTEAGPNNFFIQPEKAMKKIGSIGKSMLFNEVKLVNENGDLCRSGEVGELYIKGPHVFSSYWNKPDETAIALCKGWLRTEDLARFDDDGDYTIVGRKKELIISGGENVYPQEVEQCLLQLEGVSEVAVVGQVDAVLGEVVTAFIVIADGTSINETAIIAHCKKFIGNYKVPKVIIQLSALPKTHVGKIDKNKLKTMYKQSI